MGEDVELCPFYVEDGDGQKMLVDPSGASLALQMYKEHPVSEKDLRK